jgi:hypothetical protein
VVVRIEHKFITFGATTMMQQARMVQRFASWLPPLCGRLCLSELGSP